MISIAIENPLQDDVRALIAELNATLLELTPPQFVFHMTAEQMAEPDTTVFIAREDGQAVAVARSSATPAASARSSVCIRGPPIAAARSAR